jgi:hypothetical protein
VNLHDVVTAVADYSVVLEPDENTPEWWAGAPSVAVGDDGTFYLAARMREGRSPRGQRGYEIRILASHDGRQFEPIHQIRREDAGVSVFERPCLRRDPATGAFKLWGCSALEPGWGIMKFEDAELPADFDPAKWEPVLTPAPAADEFVHVAGYKDPVIEWIEGRWHMLVIAADRVERIGHFVSDDGRVWRAASTGTVLDNTGWHNFFTRPASLLPVSIGYLLVYEGSAATWHDPVYNIATGLAYSPDLEHFTDLTPQEPLLTSTTPGDYQTWRYSAWVRARGKTFVYFEAARPNNTNELRVAVFDDAGC